MYIRSGLDQINKSQIIHFASKDFLIYASSVSLIYFSLSTNETLRFSKNDIIEYDEIWLIQCEMKIVIKIL